MDDYPEERRQWQECRLATGMARTQFLREVDEQLRGDRDPLPESKRKLRILVARYGWGPVLQAAEHLARKRNLIIA